MIPSHRWLEDISAVLWPALADHLCQATLVAVVCFLTFPLFRHAKPQARHTLWLVAFMRFAVPPALVLFIARHLGLTPYISTPLRQASTAMSQVTQPLIQVLQPAATGATATAEHSELYCLLTLIWILGSVGLFIRWRLQHHRFSSLLRTGQKEQSGPLLQAMQSLAKKLGMGNGGNLRMVSGNFEPGVWGVWRPVLVLPENILKQLDADEVEAILAHELVHVTRWDNLWSNLQMLLCCIFWFHPLVWILDRRLIHEREGSCDERVIAILQNSRAYISGLVKMARLSLGFQVAGISPMAGIDLKGRIADMKTTNRRTGLPAKILLPVLGAFALFLYLGAVPIDKSIALATPSGLEIENKTGSPLEIVTASVADIKTPAQRTSQITTYLINPRIVVRNNSDRIVSVYVLEFRKAGLAPLYCVRSDLSLAPKGTDSIDAEVSAAHASLYAMGPRIPGTGGAWSVRLDVVRFKDGSAVTLNPSPIPPPSANQSIVGGMTAEQLKAQGKTVPGGIVGGIIGRMGPVTPPSPVKGKTPKKAVVVDPDQFISRPSKQSIVGGIPGGIVGGGLKEKGKVPPPPPPPPASPPPPAPPQDEKQESVGKTVSVRIEHSGDKAFDRSRLDGSVLVLKGRHGTFRSTPVLSDNGRSRCRFSQPIPTGEYALNIEALKMTAAIVIPNLPQSAVTMKISMSKNIVLTFQ